MDWSKLNAATRADTIRAVVVENNGIHGTACSMRY